MPLITRGQFAGSFAIACGVVFLTALGCDSGAKAPAKPAVSSTSGTTTTPHPAVADGTKTAPPITQPAVPADSEKSPPRDTPPTGPQTAPLAPQVQSQNLFAGNAPGGMPAVHLSQAHERSCKLKVGDSFPTVTLPDSAGKATSWEQLRGKQATLVVFWSMTEPTSLEQLRDLQQLILPAYGNLGLRVVAINSFDTPAIANAELSKIKPAFPCLHDAGGKFFGQVGEHFLPRIYLLDGQGKILWLDLEYSRTTRRLLQQALQTIWQEI